MNFARVESHVREPINVIDSPPNVAENVAPDTSTAPVHRTHT
ncbi:MAG TPA: hypothetical protein PLV93_08515 [Microthrixaceae bacterium]|nr:hypothetical protein [Microthrixaceae bacterium]